MQRPVCLSDQGKDAAVEISQSARIMKPDNDVQALVVRVRHGYQRAGAKLKRREKSATRRHSAGTGCGC